MAMETTGCGSCHLADRQGTKAGFSLCSFQPARAAHGDHCEIKPRLVQPAVLFNRECCSFWCVTTPMGWHRFPPLQVLWTAEIQPGHKPSIVQKTSRSLLFCPGFGLLCYLEHGTPNATLSTVLTCTCLKPLEMISLFLSPLPPSHVLFHERGIRELGSCCGASGARCRDVTPLCKFFLYPSGPCCSLSGEKG